jgi:hypothetical protein
LAATSLKTILNTNSNERTRFKEKICREIGAFR